MKNCRRNKYIWNFFEVYEIFSLKWMTQTKGEMEPFKKTYICIAMDLHHKISKKNVNLKSHRMSEHVICIEMGKNRYLWNSILVCKMKDWKFQVFSSFSTFWTLKITKKKWILQLEILWTFLLKAIWLQLFLDQPD